MAKLGIVEEEADETCFWIELLMDGQLMKPAWLEPLLREANEIVAIITASRKSLRTTKPATGR
jgi:four helix bundle protein